MTAAVGFGCDAGSDRQPFVKYEEDDVLRAINQQEAPDTFFLEEPGIRIGGPEAEGPAVFGSINQVEAIDGDGFLVVDSQGEGSLRKFDSTGTFVDEIGDRGEGPGEFSQPFQVEVFGDTVLVWSLIPRRMSQFLTDGTFLNTMDFEKPSAGLPFRRLPEGFLDEREWGQTYDTRPAEAMVVRVRGGEVSDTVMDPYPVPEYGWEIIDEESQAGAMVNPPVFSARPIWSLCENRIVWGDPRTGEVEIRHIDGGLLEVVELARDSTPITQEHRRAYADAVGDAFGLEEEQRSQVVQETQFAEYAPLLTEVLCSSRRQLWIADFSPAVARPIDAVGNEWDVLDVDRRVLARVRFPPGFRLMDIDGGRAYGVGVGEFGVDVVEIYDLPAAIDGQASPR